MINFDTETCGFEGPAITIQWADGGGPVNVWQIWKHPVAVTLGLIKLIVQHEDGVCAFNLVYDWFHIQQIYCLLSLCKGKSIPPIISEVAANEKKARESNICLKPQHALDLMLTARKGKYQATMERRPILIKNIPKECVNELAKYLERSLRIPDIFFARRPHGNDIFDTLPGTKPGFVHLRLRFFASGGLKNIVLDAGLVDKVDQFTHVPYNPHVHWSEQIQRFIDYWANNPRAAKYAEDDVKYLQLLYNYFNQPEPDSLDDQLAICVACCKYHGYALDLEKIRKLLEKDRENVWPFNPNSPDNCLYYLHSKCTKLEQAIIPNTSSKTLQEVEKLSSAVGGAASEIIEARHSEKRKNLYTKLLQQGRFYPNFKVIGARSGRMSGGSIGRKKGSINPQGIQRDLTIRNCFILKDTTLPILTGGDFVTFEPTILDAVVDSPRLRKELQSGKKIYDIIGNTLAPASNYHDRKTGYLGYSYGAQPEKLALVYGITIEQAKAGLKELTKQYPEIEDARRRIQAKFCSMSQPDGIGTEVKWADPDDYIETLFGFCRDFTLEHIITKTLFECAESLPQSIHKLTGSVERSKRQQTLAGACRSALYAAAFAIQAQNMRAAFNHVIQGSGAQICKDLQSKLWQLQPKGIHPWHVAPFNVHDEVQCPVRDAALANVTEHIAAGVVHKYKEKIPLIRLDWGIELKNWGSK